MKLRLLGFLCLTFIMVTVAFSADSWKTTVDLDGRQVHEQETNIGNFIADAIRDTAKSDIAVLQASAFQGDAFIKAGLIDEQTFRSKLTSPTSKLYVLAMRPAVLRKMMERAVGKSGLKPFLQISGMTVIYDSSKDSDNRVISIIVNGKSLNFNDEKTTLTVAMPEELGRGASGYTLIYPKEVKASTKEVKDQTLIDAIKSECTRLKGEIGPTTQGRLKDEAARKDDGKKDK